MKKINQYLIGLVIFAFTLTSCEENEILPDLQTVGTSTATLADISAVSAAPGGQADLTLTYVNLAEDPATQIEILVSIDGADFTSFATLNESSAQTDAEITRTVPYPIPSSIVSGTSITFDMLLSTANRQFPQRERASISVE